MGRFYKFIGHRTTDIRHLISLASVNLFTPPMTAGDVASCWTVGGHRPLLQLHIGETERILISPEAYDRIPDFACSLDNGTDILG